MKNADKIELNDILIAGEEVIYNGKPKKSCYLFKSILKASPLMILFLICDSLIAFRFFSSYVSNEDMPLLIIILVMHLLPVWKCVASYVAARMEYKNIIYGITDRRIIVRDGIIGLDFENVGYAEIANIRVDVGIIERFFNAGTITIKTTSGNKVFLRSIEEPYRVYKLLNQVYADVKTDIYYPNALRPDTNPGYQTKYQHKELGEDEK